VKILGGIGEPLVGRLLLYDAMRMRLRDITLPRDPECPVCGDRPTIREVQATGEICGPVSAVDEISPELLAEWQRGGQPHLLVDVREPAEHAVGAIEGAILVPLAQVGTARDRWPRTRPVVVYCRTGMRSRRAARLLRSLGIDARSLAGGIEAWHRRVPDA